MSLVNTINLSFDMTKVLTEMEVHGIKINVDTLHQLRDEYQIEMLILNKKLDTMVKEAMGDTPINLDSGEDRSMVMYSCKVKDKNIWKNAFNLGTEVRRGGAKRPKRRPNLRKSEFNHMVARMTDVIYKTKVRQCNNCRGSGTIKKYTVKGELYKIAPKCPKCIGKGVVYISTGEVAGFKLVPTNIMECTVNGFKTDMDTATKHITETNATAKEFLQSYTRYSAIRTYLRTFIEGIERGLDVDNFIHPQFMQCVTATGRLSSRNPNFQNMPRGSTFPVRKAIVSRFNNGFILEGDYRQLEFRVAGFLSKDKQLYRDVENNVDVHQYTADTMGVERQDAKAHTFKPLYGGMSGTEDEKRYYKAFLEKYKDIAKWHESLQSNAIQYKKVQTPSGREYAFPYAQRQSWGGSSYSTQIKNYPVQGFATADIVPIACINAYRMMQDANVKSLLINTVHDSIVVDVHPDEIETMTKLLNKATKNVIDSLYDFYKVEFNVPLDTEIKVGHNWLDMQEIITKTERIVL